jgi:hypothetical protein
MLAEGAIRKAYAWRDRASEREKLDLTAVYHQFATGQIDLAIRELQTLEANLFPRLRAPPHFGIRIRHSWPMGAVNARIRRS